MRPRLRPRPWRHSARSLLLNRATLVGATRRRGTRWAVMVKPRKLRLQGRSTALLATLTASRSRSARNRVIEAITRSPARRDRT